MGNFIDHNKMTLTEEVLTLISFEQEGAFWDFKREWYGNGHLGDMLHDIICLANNLENRDAYIIIGVDEANGYKIKNVTEDLNRKNTQKMVDFLKDKKFAGGIRPTVYVRTIMYSEKVLDVIVIKNSTNTPYYLTERFDKVRPNNIYTRIQDTNTPVDRSADFDKIEYLWKKRFHLFDAPIDKIKEYLRYPKYWDSAETGMGDIKYYRFHPEYSIETESDDRSGYEFYMLDQIDTRPHWYLVNLKYHQTILTQFLANSLDGGRVSIIAPEISSIEIDKAAEYYRYYSEESLTYVLHQFVLEKDGAYDYHAYNRFLRHVLIFRSTDEKDEFEKYVIENSSRIAELKEKEPSPKLGYVDEHDMAYFADQMVFSAVLQKMLGEFRYANICIEQDN